MTKREEIRKRNARIAELYTDGYETTQITERMLTEGSLASKSFTSAARTVRIAVADLRRELAVDRREIGKIAGGEILDAMIREHGRVLKEYRRQLDIAADEEFITITVSTPNGPIVTSKPRTATGTRQRASKDAATLSKELGRIEAQIAQKRAEIAEPTERGEANFEPGLTIIRSELSIPELIERNLGTRSVN